MSTWTDLVLMINTLLFRDFFPSLLLVSFKYLFHIGYNMQFMYGGGNSILYFKLLVFYFTNFIFFILIKIWVEGDEYVETKCMHTQYEIYEPNDRNCCLDYDE